MRASTDDSALRGVRGPLALICAVVVLLAGCSATHRDPASKVPLVPWDGALPPQLQAGHVVPASPCRASRLRVVGTGFLFQPAIAGGTGSVTLRNAGPGACRLTGRPDVRLVGAVPAPQQRQVPLPAEPPAFPTVVAPDATLLALPAGGTATLGVDWRNWCLPHGRRAPVPPRAARITLPGGRGSIDAGYNAVPSCDAPGQPATIGVRPFQPSPVRVTTPWTAGIVQATIQPLPAPRRDARPGRQARGPPAQLPGRQPDSAGWIATIRDAYRGRALTWCASDRRRAGGRPRTAAAGPPAPAVREWNRRIPGAAPQSGAGPGDVGRARPARTPPAGCRESPAAPRRRAPRESSGHWRPTPAGWGCAPAPAGAPAR